MTTRFRIHPTIGFARVGTSSEFLLAPESHAGMPLTDSDQTGGLPILPFPDGSTTTARSSDLRDEKKRLKRQAARFKIYTHQHQEPETYPLDKQTQEINIGSIIDGKKVVDIIWTVHLANKKANWYQVPESLGIDAYQTDRAIPHPPVRNAQFGKDIHQQDRLRKLVIDPGPRAIKGSSHDTVHFNPVTTPTHCEDGTIQPIENYPMSFPGSCGSPIYYPQAPLETLGELRTDSDGRLIATGGYGRTAAYFADEDYKEPMPLQHDTSNDGWFDDSGDGPVTATLIFDDGTHSVVSDGAWLVVSDPAYAPQTINSVTLWDDIYDVWVRHMDIRPDIYKDSQFNGAYKPTFKDQVQPILRSANSHRWVTNLNRIGNAAHQKLEKFSAAVPPTSANPLGGLSSIRDPDQTGPVEIGKMPMALGDAGHSLLSLTKTQVFLLQQWNGQLIDDSEEALTAGETLDRINLFNCQGGRMSPGIDVSICARDPAIWKQNWQTSGSGPFRVHIKQLDYSTASEETAFLGAGYIPQIKNNPRNDEQPIDTYTRHEGLEPGDMSKFMALPWHTDYNSCATHQTDETNQMLFWSWPAQRPVAVYVADEVSPEGQLPQQKYSVRGEGTHTQAPAAAGRFTPKTLIVQKWQDIGIVIQSTAIDNLTDNSNPDHYLEVQSLLGDDSDDVPPWSWQGGAGKPTP